MRSRITAGVVAVAVGLAACATPPEDTIAGPAQGWTSTSTPTPSATSSSATTTTVPTTTATPTATVPTTTATPTAGRTTSPSRSTAPAPATRAPVGATPAAAVGVPFLRTPAPATGDDDGAPAPAAEGLDDEPTSADPAAPAPGASTSGPPATSAPPVTTTDPPATTPPDPPAAGRPAPATAVGIVNGCNTYGQYCDGNPLYASVPQEGYDHRRQPVNGFVDNGVALTASCWATGGTTTNFATFDPGPDPYGSTVYFLVETAGGVRGYIPDTYFVRDSTGRLGLGPC